MRLLVLGGLGAYPERLEALAGRGHRLWYASTESLAAIRDSIPSVTAFGLEDAAAAAACLPRLIREERIEAVYSLLNAWDGSNAATATLLRRGCPVPVVRHYKEHHLSPHDDERACIEGSTGVIFLNEESRRYFAGVYRIPPRSACLDGDPIPRRYLSGPFRPKLSAADGRPHLLVAGTATTDRGRYDYRALVRELSGHGAHVHLYARYSRLQPSGWLAEDRSVRAEYRALAAESPRVHLHATIPPTRFVEEWSPYDAGLLHVPDPRDCFRALNYPNRHAAYLAAGVPVALPAGEMAAMERRLGGFGAAVVYRDPADLVARLPGPAAASAARAAREHFTWEALLPALERFIVACTG